MNRNSSIFQESQLESSYPINLVEQVNSNELNPRFFTNFPNDPKKTGPISMEVSYDATETRKFFDKALNPELFERKSPKNISDENKVSDISLNISQEENRQLEEEEDSQRKKSNASLKKAASKRKSYSICVSNNAKRPGSEEKIDVKPENDIRVDSNPKLKKLGSPVLLLPAPRHSILKMEGGLMVKKRASFQIPPTYQEEKREDLAPLSKSPKISSITSLKHQSRLVSNRSSKKYTHISNLIRKETKKTSTKTDEILKPQSAFYQVISNLYLTKKFITILKNLTSFRKPKFLKQFHFNMMNDLSFDFSNYQNLLKQKKEKKHKIKEVSKAKKILNESWEKSIETGGFFLNLLPIFDPTKQFSIFWDSLVILAICFFFVLIPLDISFESNVFESINELVITKTVFLYVLCFDIFKSCNSSYYHKGLLVKNRKKVIVNYIKTNFAIDLITITPLLLHEAYYDQGLALTIYHNKLWYLEILQLLFFLKYRHFSEISKKLGELVFIDRNIQNAVALIKLIFRIVVLAHIFACVWYMVGNSGFYLQDNWIVKNDLNQSDWWMQYVYAYYFVCVTMNTVGFGDITPQNPLEVGFVIVFIFVACGVFAYSINSIGIIVGDIWKRQNEFTKDLNVINQFMREKNINFELTMRVRKYLEYIWNEEKLEEVEQQVRIINKLSDSLKDELLLEANGPVIKEIKLFALNFSEETLRKMISIMKEVRFTPGDLIFTKNELSNSLYILRRGEVELFIDRTHSSNNVTVLKKLSPGDIFGELSFFTDFGRTTSARSTDFTNVFMIRQEDFLEILRQNSHDFQRFCEIKDNIKIFDQCDDLFLRCFSCKSVSHQLRYCPLLHYIPKNDIIVQRYNYSENQTRSDQICKRPLKYNCRRNLDKIEKSAYKLQEEIFPRHETSSSEDSDEEEKEENEDNNDSLDNSEDKSEKISKKNLVSEENNSILASQNNISNIENQMEDSKGVKFLMDEEETEVMRANNRQVKRRKSRKRIFWKKENSKKSFSKQNSAFSQKGDHGKYARESLYVNPSEFQKKYSVSSSEEHAMMEASNMNMTSSEKTQYFNNPQAFVRKEEFNDIDKVKFFEEYFPHNNIDRIIHSIEVEKFKKLNKKIKKSNFLKSKYQLFIQNNLNVNETIPMFLRGSTLYDKKKASYLKESLRNQRQTADKNNNNNSQLNTKRYYFKNDLNLQKLIAQEKFDPEQIKEYYRKKYMREQKRKIIQKFFKNIAKKGKEFFKSLGKLFRKKEQEKKQKKTEFD